MSTRQNQLERILANIDRQIAEAEAEMLKTLTDDELQSLIERQADLQVRRQHVELKIKNSERVKGTIGTLTGRELEVFTLIGGGLSTSMIAERLHITVSTVETYRDRLKDKLELGTAAELLRAAFLWIQRRQQ